MECPISSEDIFVDILCKLKNLKDLVRCKCVSKRWDYLISNTCLPKLWNSIPINGLIFRSMMFPIIDMTLTLYNYRWCDRKLRFLTLSQYTHSMIYASLDDGGVVVDNNNNDDDEFDQGFQGLPSLNLMPCDHEIHASDFLNCCNGLLLFVRRRCFQYYVCNPTTKQCLPVPFPILASTHQESEYVTLAFDPSEALQFRVIQFTLSGNRFQPPRLDIFYSESREWVSHNMKHDSGVVDWSRSQLLKHSTYLNGVLYRLSMTQKKLHCIDLRDLNAYRVIDLPREEPKSLKESGCIGVLKNSLHFCDSVGTIMHVWMLLDDLQQLRWLLKYKISTKDWPNRLYSTFKCSGFYEWIEPTAFHPHIDVVFISTPQRIISYDLETEEIESVCDMTKGLRATVPKYFPSYIFIHCPISFNNFNERRRNLMRDGDI